MKLIRKDTDYAIKALCFIARRKNEVVSVKELVRCLNIPKPFLRKLLQVLNKEKLLKSYKGVGGGFKMAVTPDKISLVRLINIFQGPITLSEHKLKKRVCPGARGCFLKKNLDLIEKDINDRLSIITIKTLIENGKEV